MEKLYTPLEVCDLLNIKLSKLRTMIFLKKINYIKVGRLLRFAQSDLESWVEKQKVRNVDTFDTQGN